MSMPQIPEGTHRPDLNETVIDLFESIALEEIAISHILNAQGEQLQALIAQYKHCALSTDQLLQGCRHTQDLLNSLIMKEWLLYNKLGSVMTIKTTQPTCKPFNCSTCIHRECCNKQC